MVEYNICSLVSDVFDELKELLHYSLLELGYQSTITDNVVSERKINIVFGAHYDAALVDMLPKNSIIFNTEQLDSDSSHDFIRRWTQNLLILGQQFTVWDYNLKNMVIWEQHQVKARLFQFGYQKHLHRIERLEKPEIDVLFYGAVNDRRRRILDELRARSVNVLELPGIYGRYRDAFIGNAKLVLNMHHFDTEIFEIVRCSYLMNNGIPIVSEVNETTTIDPFYLDGIAAAPYESLVDKCIELLNDDVKRQEQGYKGLATLSQRPQFMLLKDLL